MSALAIAKMRPSSPAVSGRTYEAHLREHVQSWYPELEEASPRITRIREQHRPWSQLYEFQIEAPYFERSIIYKIPGSAKRIEIDSVEALRPRLFPHMAAPHERGRREFHALSAIHVHFQQVSDTRFGTIRPLALLRDPDVLVMEKSPDPSLRQLLKRATRFHPRRNRESLLAAFHNAGAWLRRFHSLAPLEHTQSRHGSRQEFLDLVHRFTGTLRQFVGHVEFFDHVDRLLDEAVQAILPKTIPQGLVHGDFAPRNILVDERSRVTLLDTLARWQAPIYEDLAYLLRNTRASTPQVLSQGILYSQGDLDACERALLEGYFPDGISHRSAVRLYECLLILEWWTALNVRAGKPRRGTWKASRGKLLLFDGFLKRHLDVAITSL